MSCRGGRLGSVNHERGAARLDFGVMVRRYEIQTVVIVWSSTKSQPGAASSWYEHIVSLEMRLDNRVHRALQPTEMSAHGPHVRVQVRVIRLRVIGSCTATYGELFLKVWRLRISYPSIDLCQDLYHDKTFCEEPNNRTVSMLASCIPKKRLIKATS
jgi:hypothetical protein